MVVGVQNNPITSAREVQADRDIVSWTDPSFKKLQQTLRVERPVFLPNFPELRDGNRSIDIKNS
jgi:hypothetical protein